MTQQPKRLKISWQVRCAAGLVLVAPLGCGTTKWSDTPRTATEQLLISCAVDRAVNNIDFTPLAGKDVYLDPTYLANVVDKDYVISTLHQHMRAQGCLLKSKQEDATYIVEARAGAVGTNHHDVLVGIPSINVPTMGMAGIPSAIPEIPFAKSTDQKALAKIVCFAYNQRTGQHIWQSGVFPVVTNAKDTWILGTGPFQRGSIRDETHFAGARLRFWRRRGEDEGRRKPEIPVTAEALFPEDAMLAQRTTPAATTSSAAAGAPANNAAAGSSPGAPSTNAPSPTPTTVPAPASPPPVAGQQAAGNQTSGVSSGTSTTSAAAPISGTTGFSGVMIGAPTSGSPTSGGPTSGQELRLPAKL